MNGPRRKIMLPGERYGRLVVLGAAGVSKSGHRLSKCRCDCGTVLDRVNAAMQTGKTTSCGCWRGRRRFVVENLFIPEPNSGCFIWLHTIKTNGYGTITDGNKEWLAHRYVWTKLKGPLPESSVLRHRCDTPICVNPDHLIEGTQAENMQDCVARNRFNKPKGTAHKNAKMTDDLVRQLRQDHRPIKVLEETYGIKKTNIHVIKTGKAWRHIK